MIKFQNPYMLIVLAVIPLYIVLQIWFKKKFTNKIPFSRTNLLIKAANNKRRSFSNIDIMRYVTIFLLIIALCEPEIRSQKKVLATWERSNTDIVICLDVSGSMLIETGGNRMFTSSYSNRLRDAKKVIENFVGKLQGQQVSLITFSNSAQILTPLSDDYSLVIEKTKEIDIDRSKQALTAIGMGISLSAAVLKDSPAESKFIILITDGVNNTGVYQPLEATKSFAVPYDLKIYPIGFNASRTGGFTGDDVDIETLNKIAQLTGSGKAELASSSEALETIIDNIGKSENIQEDKELPNAYSPVHNLFISIAFLLLLLEFYLRKVKYYEVQ
ncbi:MAG: VWA domain-containing protein [Candidatus Cloacimonadales bacterium]